MSVKTIGIAFGATVILAMIPAALAQPRSTGAKIPSTNTTSVGGSGESGGSMPNAMQGFQQNRGQPVQIEAARLEVRDKQHFATFSGDVKVVQGDTTMRCKTLVVFYEQKSGDTPTPQPMPAAQPGPGGASQISRLEARGSVVVTQKDQTATGETALFDMKANTVTLLTNVVVSQGPNVVRGERLVVDLSTGVSKVDAGNSNGPVRMLIQNGVPQAQGSGLLGSTPAPAPAPRSGPQRSSN
jgi:lipopolysaccharide export system protein LptA